MKMIRKLKIYANFVVVVALFFVLTLCHQAQGQPKNYAKEIEKYVQYLKTNNQSSVDYILSLFQKYDLVILCERTHPEMTQYDLILNILSDKQFTDQVGHLFTESGASSLRPAVESFLMDTTLDEKGIEEHVRRICRDFNYYPLREMTNYYELLIKVHQLNGNLPEDKRVHIYPSDIPFSWDGMTLAKYQKFRDSLRQRDKIMANQIAEKFEAIYNSPDPRKKALIIMNYRHAFGHLKINLGGRTRQFENVGGFLMDYFPDMIANVMINSIRPLAESTDNKIVMATVQDGKWDAAFSALGNPDVGFDFSDSPFGNDSFDYFPLPSQYRYQNIFTGFVFYKPLDQHKMSMGIPGLVDTAFANELIRRYEIEGQIRSRQEIMRKNEEHKTIREFGYENKELFEDSGCKETIQKWLR